MVDKDFAAANPHLKEFFPYLEIVNKESERGKVLVSAGFLEEQLKQLLLAFMLKDDRAIELVDGANAPLGTFNARMTASYLLGLIYEIEYHDLVLIRRVRNDFAHSIHASFSTPSVIDRCKRLKLKAQDYTRADGSLVVVDAAGQFTSAAVGLIMNLTNRAYYVSKERRTSVNWLI